MRFITRALVTATLVAAPVLGLATSAGATANACNNQSGDIDVLDTVGVDQYDAPPSGNGMLAVCHPGLGGDTFSGVRVDQDENGTCVAVILNGIVVGCSSGAGVI
jgi:hypothetical protein